MIKRIIIIIIPLLLCVKMFFALLSAKPLIIIPGKHFTVLPLTDRPDNGNSVSKIKVYSERKVVFEYILHSGFQNPYAGIVIKKNGLFDISECDRLRITICSGRASKLRIFIHTEIKGFSEEGKATSYLFNCRSVSTTVLPVQSFVPLKNFTVPFWWYALHNTDRSDPRLITDFSRVKQIEIQNYPKMLTGKKDTVCISRLQFEKSPRATVLTYGIPFILYIICLLIIMIIKKRRAVIIKKIKSSMIPYRYLVIEDEETKQVLKYLNENYKSTDLVVKRVSTDLNVPVKRVSRIIKKTFGLNFPQYLNAIRLREAKQLLVETDLPVTDIAFEVGYNNAAYFNYRFKMNEGQSPGEYRKKRAEQNE